MSTRVSTNPLAWLTLLLSISLLTACGFHLRGSQEVPADKRIVSLQTGPASEQLSDSLRNNLRYNGVEISSAAPYSINIIYSRYKRRAVTLNSRSEVDEYELALDVSFHIADAEGKPLTEDIRLRRERVYTYNRDAAAASSEQESLLRQELYDAMAQNIIRRYLASGQQ